MQLAYVTQVERNKLHATITKEISHIFYITVFNLI